MRSSPSYFETRIFPILTPLAVDPAHPFPYISDLALSFGIVVERPDGRRAGFARVKVPPNLPRLVALPGGGRYVYLEDIIGDHLAALFPGARILSRHVFRVTRDADLDIQEDEADDLLAALEVELLQRRLGRAVRLEVEVGTPEPMVQLLLEELDLGPDDVYEVDARLGPGAPVGPVAPRPARPEGRAVAGGRQPPAGGRRGVPEPLRRGAAPGRARPPSLRVLRRHRRGVRAAGGRGPRRARDQDDPLPHLRRQPDRRGA